MRILYIVPYMPNRIRTRPFNLIRNLSRHGHAVTVLTLTENDDEVADAQALMDDCSRVVTLPLSRWRSLLNCVGALPSGTPLQSVYSWEPALIDQLGGGSNGHDGAAFDVVHVEHLRGARYGLALKSRNLGKIPVVWDSVDCISHLFRQAATQSRSRFGRFVTRLELDRTAAFEAQLLRAFDRTLVTSEADRRALLALMSEDDAAAVDVLPNGVDLDYFTPAEGVQRDASTLVVSGKMSYHANVTMVLNLVSEIMPRIWAQEAQVKLLIVGKDPGPEIEALAEDPRITVTGTVPDIRPFLQRATVAVAPLAYGAGIQNKVLEAMACATPVVTSPQGVAALDVEPERDLILAADADAFARAIVGLLAHPQRQREIGEAGRRYVETHHSWLQIAARLSNVYDDVQRAYADEL